MITNMLHNESVRGIVSNFRDVTERKENELQQEKITVDLTERNKNLEQYAYIVSHNLRGPVANILGISNLLEIEGQTVDDKAASLQHLFQSTRRLDEVVKDLNMILELRQRINEQREDVDLDELVRDTTTSIHDLVSKSNVEIITNFPEIRSISTVKSYLHSIFYNLITNSIKYKREDVHPTINITSRKGGDRICIRFADNGMGIDLAAHGSKLFGLYKRFHPDQAEGKGVGLFMTKTQVEALGGKISVTSQVNTGTEFIVEL
jgi:signal transduction histidine kinase